MSWEMSMAGPVGSRLGLRIAVAGLGVELAAAVAAAVVGVVSEVAGSVALRQQGLGVTVFAVVVALALVGILRGVARRRRWATAPALTVQLVVLFAFVWPFIAAGQVVVGFVVGLLALGTVIALIVQARDLPAPRLPGRSDD